MALKIRLQRKGAAHRPVYRVVIAESTSPRDGRHVEVLGHYSPKAKGRDPEYRINLERYDYWYGQGARPTDTTRTLVNRARREQAAAEAAAPAAEATVPVAEVAVPATETAAPAAPTAPAES